MQKKYSLLNNLIAKNKIILCMANISLNKQYFKILIDEDWVKSALHKIGYMKHNLCAKITREC